MTAKSSIRRAAWAFVACVPLWALGGCGACEPDRRPSAQDASHQAAVPPAADPSLRAGTPAPLRCRAITVDGDVRTDGDAGSALAPGAEIPGEGWLSLAASARLVAKDPRTTRETTFRGPARARVCVDASEEAWLAGGTLQSAPGTGEVPGGEEWIVTPLGVVRFAAAAVTVESAGPSAARERTQNLTSAGPSAARERTDTWTMSDARARLTVGGGVAFVWVASDATLRRGDGGVTSSPVDEGWIRIAEGAVTLFPTASPAQLAALHSAVDGCATLSKAAHELAVSLLGTGADGTTAARQVTTRRLARAACEVAALRLDLLPPSAEREAIAASLNEASRAWRMLPFVAR